MAKKVLVIEDDNILQKAVKESLEDAGFEVGQAFDGQKGLSMVRSEKPDLIILDLILPKKDGWSVLKEIKKDEEIKDIPVLIFTVYEKEDSIAECVELGVKGYFFKSSYSLEEIIKRVKEII